MTSPRGIVLAVGQYVGRWVAWTEQNKAGLASVGTAIGAVYNGVLNGADSVTLILAVVSVYAALTHLTSTPLSNPKTLHGTPLVPATPSLTVSSPYVQTAGGSSYLLPTAGASLSLDFADPSDRLALLPAPHPSGKRKGAVITTDRRDYKPSRLKSKTADVSEVWQSIESALKIVLLNDRLGDCTIAGVLKLYAILLTIAGRPVPAGLLSDAVALRLYEQWDGYVAGDPSTDQGGDPRQVLKDAQRQGVDGVRLGTFAAVPNTTADVKAALRAHGALYSALYLPDDYERMGFRWVVQPHNPPDPNEGHCVVVVMSKGRFYALTWGGVASVSATFLERYFVQHFAVDGLA